MIILSASKECQLSQEDAGSGGGRFSITIDNNLTKRRGAFDLDGNGAISVAKLDRGLKAEVVRDSKGRQTPWLSRNLMVGDIDIFRALCGSRQRWHDAVHDSFSRETDIRLATVLTRSGHVAL